jgi:hypothetical protein
MNRIHLPLAAMALLYFSLPALAADPAWWAARGVTNGNPSSNLSPATIGQAKHMAAMALVELGARLSAEDFLALKNAVAAVVDLDVPVLPEVISSRPATAGRYWTEQSRVARRRTQGARQTILRRTPNAPLTLVGF